MSELFRIQSAAGRWACLHAGARAPWISEDLIQAWRMAAQARPNLSQHAEKCFQMASLLGCSGAPRSVSMPLTPDQLMEARRQLSKARLDAMRSGSYGRESDWIERQRGGLLASIERSLATRREVAVVERASLEWCELPGSASLLTADEAAREIERAKWSMELSALLPQAARELKKTGLRVEPWMEPWSLRLPAAFRELASAQAVAFDPASELARKEAFAVYAELEGQSGFLDVRGAVKMDLSEARLFPTLAAAKAMAAKHCSSCHAVSLDVGLSGAQPLLGAPPASPTLSSALASREARALEAAMRSGRVEALEREVARLRSELAGAHPGAAKKGPGVDQRGASRL